MKAQGFAVGDPRAHAAGKKGGQVSGENRSARRAQSWVKLGIDPVLAEQIRRAGYQAGYAQGRKSR